MDFEPLAPERSQPLRKIEPVAYNQSDDKEEIVFDPYWLVQIVLRHWLISSSVFLASIVLCLLFFLKDPPYYTATAKMKIEPKRPVFNFERLTSFDLYSIEFLQTQIKMIQSRSLVKEVIDSIGMDEYLHSFDSSKHFLSHFVEMLIRAPQSQGERIADATSQMSDAVNLYLENLKVAPDVQAPQIVVLKYQADDPAFAMKVVNEHAKLFIDMNMKSNVVYTADYIGNLEKLIAEADEQISSQNEEILAYKKEHGFFQIQGMSSFDPVQDIDDRLSRVREQMGQINETLSDVEADYEFLFLPDRIGDPDAVRKDVITSNTLERIRTRRNELLQSWADIKDRYGENHPQYVSVRNKLDAAEKSLNEEIAIHVQRAKKALDEATATKKKLIEEEQELIQEKYRRDSEWNALKSMEKAKEQLEQQRARFFQDLQNAKSSRETQQQTQNRTYQVVDYAELPTRASNRNWFKIFLLTFAVGCTLTLSGVLLVEMQDKTLRTPYQVEMLTGISVMGCIPQTKSLKQSQIVGRFSEEDSSNSANEAFIALRTRLLFSDMISQTQTVLFTSAGKGEGKSTVAVNLASSVSLLGKRVVLIDCDLRKPSLHRFFGEPIEPGLIDVIDDRNVLESVVFETDMPGLFLIPAGARVTSPSEILTSPAFDAVIEELRNDFDYIFIDSPSVLATPDPTILAPRIDMTLLVVCSGKTVKDDLLSSIDHISQTGGAVYATVLNSVPPIEREAYARYGYGQSYYNDSPNQA